MLLVSSIQAYSAENTIPREWFYIGSGPSYSIADDATGINLRAGIPMQKGLHFVSQATYFPSSFGYDYEEFRYEFNVELTAFSIKKFSIYASAGLNFGYWKRNFTTLFLNPPSSFKQDNSLLFGGGMNYKLKRIQFFTDYKWYPEIWSHQASIGFKFNFFENKTVKNAYFDFLKRGGKLKTISN
ncbi:MAG: hypothetical protein ACJAZ2_000933 [Glaciecola sp.]|jgi:hypothetical protein